jgi:hypothetical protein
MSGATFWSAVTCHRFVLAATCRRLRTVIDQRGVKPPRGKSGDKSPHSKKKAPARTRAVVSPLQRNLLD